MPENDVTPPGGLTGNDGRRPLLDVVVPVHNEEWGWAFRSSTRRTPHRTDEQVELAA